MGSRSYLTSTRWYSRVWARGTSIASFPNHNTVYALPTGRSEASPPSQA